MKKAVLILALCVGSLMGMVKSQSLERQVISSTGTTLTNPSVTVSFTVGEPVIESMITGSVILTQGFQQSDTILITSVDPARQEIELNYAIYPNPTSHFINLVLSSNEPSDLIVRLTDMAGKELLSQDVAVEAGKESKLQLDISNLSQGFYLLSLYDLKGLNSETFKIQVKR